MPNIAHVALPVPLDRNFDYLIPQHLSTVIGGRVLVPFGRQKLVGIVIAIDDKSDFSLDKLKPIIDALDQQPIWPEKLYSLLRWASHYYHYPLGETFANALPSYLKKGKPATRSSLRLWRLTEQGREQPLTALKRAPKQVAILTRLANRPVEHQQLIEEEISTATLKAVEKKGWVESFSEAASDCQWHNHLAVTEEKPRLNHEQSLAVATINAQNSFACYLLDGVTGSGKTEVYLNVIESVLAKGQQALVLVPEIGLTPQTISRFQRRFNVPIAVIHSGLNDTERFQAWLDARDNQVGIVLGTRSALFVPFADLGIAIIDEEHDSSYKQQDSLRYHARDLAVFRANQHKVPIILGSATPSIETLHNVQTGKYHSLVLSQRAGNAIAATYQIIDVKGLYLQAGLSAPMLAEMRKHLNAGNQVMLFLNRRGYSPTIICHECGWIADCPRCDTHYTYHQHNRELCCHHCGIQRPVMHQCGSCGSTQLQPVGVGTEQLEQQLNELFSEYKTIRIDRDNTRRKGELESHLNAIHNNEYQILIGTQMLAKGHHFPNVTLVGLIDVDSALFSSDFRAPERLAQLFIQVAGRAGRASKPGTVLLQTHQPEHPLLQTLLTSGYPAFSQTVLQERQQTMLPPYVQLALFRAESNDSDSVEQLLQQIKGIFQSHPLYDVNTPVLGPIPAPLARRAGKYRWQLILQTPNRTKMQQIIASAKPAISLLPLAKKVRWTIDIDPQDMS